MTDSLKINITTGELKNDLEVCAGLIRDLRFPQVFTSVDSGRYGWTHTALNLLNAIERGCALGLTVNREFSAAVSTAGLEGFAPPRELHENEQVFIRAFSLYAACSEVLEHTPALLKQAVRVENHFKLDEVRSMLVPVSTQLSFALLKDLLQYVEFHIKHDSASHKVDSSDKLAACIHAYFLLLESSLRELSADPGFRHMLKALEEAEVRVLDRDYQGFSWTREEESSPSGLIDIGVDQIVGNGDYLDAAMSLARDVAGYDFERGENPKTFNPVLFALGRPGCGKTVTAHAVGQWFLDFCKERDIPSRFLVIRRTDWASSYQNASANSLIRIFKEQVRDYDGVVGVYWPDIDTAFAARNDGGIRSEEKNILGACFGIFDGTLLPKNGKWFMMCDANFMNMDEATISRITQDPYMLKGADTPETYLELLRDVKLGKHAAFTELNDDEWAEVAQVCYENDFSGRGIDNISRKLIAAIQDFEYPDEYFKASYERRLEIIGEQSRVLKKNDVIDLISRYATFEKESEERAEKDRFKSRVEEIVFNLSAKQAAAEHLVASIDQE